MATLGALSLLTAGFAFVRAVKDEDGEGSFYQEYGTGTSFQPNDAIPDKAFSEAQGWADKDVVVGGFSSHLNVNTATLVTTILAALFASWTTFQSSDSSKLIALKARAQDADHFIDQVVHKLGLTQLNVTNHEEVEQSLSVLANQHQKCLQDESSINEMFGHLQQHAEEGWIFGDDKTKASMAFDRISKELKLDVLKPEASAMQLESIVTKMQKCHVGQSGMQMQITRLAEDIKDLEKQESECQSKLLDAKNSLSDVIDETNQEMKICKREFQMETERLHKDIDDIKVRQAVCSLKLDECKKKTKAI